MDPIVNNEVGYCVLCNRGRKKGEWKSVVIQDSNFENKQTNRGIQKIIRGKCPECNSTIVAMRGKVKQENKENGGRSESN